MRLREEDLEWREVEGEILALDRRRGRYFTVTSSGALLWLALAEGTTAGALATRLSERFGIDQSRAGSDVASFLRWLDENGLLLR